MTHAPLSADDIRRLFGELASELDAAGQRAEIFLVGGAAIALCFDARGALRVTSTRYSRQPIPCGGLRRLWPIARDSIRTG